MINFYHQVGYSGLFIFILSLFALFTAIRGTVLILLLRKQSFTEHGVLADIIQHAHSMESHMLHEQNIPDRALIINTLMQTKLKGIYSSLYFLKLCAAIGPLCGLLGTVIGMVSVFSNLSSQARPDPTLLAGGIWEALLTTVMGLSLAIPALIVHYFLLTHLRQLRNNLNLVLCHGTLNLEDK